MKKLLGKKKRFLFCAVLALCISVCPIYASAVTFEGEEAGTKIAELSDLMEEWYFYAGLGETIAEIADDGENGNVLLLDKYVHMSSEKTLDTPYTFETVFRTTEKPTWMLGIFIRSGIVKDPLFPNFEVDAYDGANGSMGLGGSGMTIAIEEDGIDLRIKNYQDDSRRISTSICRLSYNGTFDATEYNKLVMKDDGKTVTFTLNDQLLATVEMSNPGTYDDGRAELPFEFYKTAVVKNAEGDILLSIDNARLVSENYCAGIGVRGDTPTYFKEITLEKAEDPSVTDPDPEPEPEPPVTDPEPPVETGDSSACAGTLALVFAAAAACTVLRRRRRAATEE